MEIRALLGSLQTQAYCPSERRRGGARWRYEVEATLWYRDEEKQVRQTPVYTRDASARGIAFLAQLNFRVGQSIILELPSKSGLPQKFQGHIRRCRQFRDGWFEGVVLFPGNVK
jgi:hypothetical protein